MDSGARAFKRKIRSTLDERKRQRLDEPDLICAAVLIPLLRKDGEWHVVVTQRTQTVAHHKGQISFPGGACESDDADALATALRENDTAALKGEFADVLAWLCTLASLAGIRMEDVLDKYTNGCPGCSEIPCSCPKKA